MENVVYITGAGFSAPLGIPVMSNFISKSKDLYNANPKLFNSFKHIYDLIDDLLKIKRYMSFSLNNIEEIISFLEMSFWLKDVKKEPYIYKDFLKKTISSYTPKIIGKFSNPNNEKKKIIKTDNRNYEDFYNLLTYFITFINKQSINFIDYDSSRNNFSGISEISNKNYNYDIITFNYDLIVEDIINYIAKINQTIGQISSFKYIKLHGSINGNIILPSWNKGSKYDLRETWKNAFEIISNANHIRFIGFSMPQSDSYIKYFIGSSLKKCFNLKTIDVITLDSDSNTKTRYNYLFSDCPNYHFKSDSIENYLGYIFQTSNSFYNKKQFNNPNSQDDFEKKHIEFMLRNGV